MHKKNEHQSEGLRVDIPQGTGESVALDKLVDDLFHGNVRGVLHELHEPGGETAPAPSATEK